MAVALDLKEETSEQARKLRQTFQLTPAEADVALALARGLTLALADHAHVRGVSLNTVRTLLKRAMAKAHCTRQVQLVALVLGRMPSHV